MSAQTLASKFEARTQGWLKLLGFKDVNGGPTFKIGGHQVDAVGGYEDTLLVIECYWQSRRKEADIRDKITEFRGKFTDLRRGFKEDQRYSKYGKLLFILATDNIVVKTKDIEYGLRDPIVHVWDERVIGHYERLARMIGGDAKYGLLGELGVQPRVKDKIQVHALKTDLGSYKCYQFFIEPSALLKVAYVARREIGKELYYQRILNPKRLSKITSFVNHGGIFPNNIIVSLASKPKFIQFKEVTNLDFWPNWLDFGVLSFPNDYRACWIIDGQHRLYGLAKASAPSRITVLAFESLTPEKQARFFIEINREQKPVDPDLLWDLQGQMDPNSEEGLISRAVKDLNRLPPFSTVPKYGIYIPLESAKKRGKIKLGGLCVAIKNRGLLREHTAAMPTAVKNPLFDADYDQFVHKAAKALSNFLSLLHEKSPEDLNNGFIFTNPGLAVLVMIFERILVRLRKRPAPQDLEPYGSSIVQYLRTNYPSLLELKRLRRECASEAGRGEVAKSMLREISRITGDKELAPELKEEETLRDAISAFERRLAKFVLDVLGSGIEDEAELREILSAEVFGIAKKRMEKDKAGGKTGIQLHHYLTLGECRKVIEAHWDEFKDYFIRFDLEIPTKIIFFEWLDFINAHRADVVHGRESPQKQYYAQLLKGYMVRIKSCFQE